MAFIVSILARLDHFDGFSYLQHSRDLKRSISIKTTDYKFLTIAIVSLNVYFLHKYVKVKTN